ncbi:uncharacterized protein CcaverHIS019_0112050 [Cutaneotrichosporon cavernicola]|uniref:Uncharacterized protein n=1 Tax=Cutaneotrichosporon cavernicola TaxID=279322 RepID=A0AA48I969_9TREE|nr:uncharacterized protein CcaverHIS019_0112050 [Cutaneotrichosporon cavernicola]BEI88487.1 hypothetical protein CcaverHIS019_0112050 [Cutaneotrichosporon cavernicola]
MNALLLLLLLLPALFLLGTVTHHLLPRNLTREDLTRALRKLMRRDLSRSAFGLPPVPSRLSVRAATFLSLCVAAATSLACGTVFLVLSSSILALAPTFLAPTTAATTTPTYPSHPPTFGPGLNKVTAALLAATTALPIVSTLLAAAGVFLRLRKGPNLVRGLLGAQGRHLTHAAVARTSLFALILTGTLVGVSAALPAYAALIILAAAASHARKSRDLLRSEISQTNTTWTHLNSSSHLNSSNDSDLLGDFSNILPPREAITQPSTPVPWMPPVGSPSSWVSEREAATLPEWDFRASLGHRRTSSSFTNRTLAALGLEPKTKRSKSSETNTFHTAPTKPSSSISSAGRRSFSAPTANDSQRPDGSVVGVFEPSPFEPLPPHNFSTITKLSVPRSAGNSDVTRSVADLGGARTFTLVDHGAHVAIHDLSNTNLSSIEHSSTANLTSIENSHDMPSTVKLTIPTPAAVSPGSPWWPSEMGDMNDTEWLPVKPPPVSEGWRRADSMCGLLGVVGLVLCFGLTVPLLVLGVHTATLTTFAVSIALPGPALAAATFFTRHIPITTPMPLPSAAGVASTAIGIEWDRNSGYRTIDFTRVDFGQPRWRAPQPGPHGSGVRISEPRDLRPVRPLTPIMPSKPTNTATLKASTPNARKHSFRRRELLKPNPHIVQAPKIRNRLGRLRGGVMSICADHTRGDSASGDEATFVSMESAEIRSAVRLTARCPSFVDLSAPQRIMFSESLQAAVVEQLTRRDADSDASYRVDSYCNDSSSPGRKGEIVRVVRAELDLGEPRIFSSSFDPARASTPLGYRPKGSTTTNIDLDLSVDWDEMGLPPNPPLPESYCGLAFAPHSISHAPSTKLDGEEMARESHEADSSIARSAGWIRALVEGWTPLRTSTNSGMSRKSTLPSIEEHRTPSRPKSWSHGTLTSGFQTPSSIARLPIQPAGRPLNHLPSLPLAVAVPPPQPLPLSLTRPISSPVGTSPLSPWTTGVYSHMMPRRVDPAPTPQRAEITRPECTTHKYSVRSTPRKAEMSKAIGAVATIIRAESVTPDTSRSELRSLTLVERAKHRKNLKDRVGSVSPRLSTELSDIISTGTGRDSSRFADASGWTEGSSRFADADDSFYQSPERATATFGRHLLKDKHKAESVAKPAPASLIVDIARPEPASMAPTYSPLRSGPAYEATLASLREYSFPTQSPSDLGIDKPVGGAIKVARGSATQTVVFDDTSRSTVAGIRTFGKTSSSSLPLSKLSTGPESFRSSGKMSTDSAPFNRSSTEPFKVFNDTTNTTTSKISSGSSKLSLPPSKDKENDPGAAVRTGRGRHRGSQGLVRALAPRF